MSPIINRTRQIDNILTNALVREKEVSSGEIEMLDELLSEATVDVRRALVEKWGDFVIPNTDSYYSHTKAQTVLRIIDTRLARHERRRGKAMTLPEKMRCLRRVIRDVRELEYKTCMDIVTSNVERKDVRNYAAERLIGAGYPRAYRSHIVAAVHELHLTNKQIVDWFNEAAEKETKGRKVETKDTYAYMDFKFLCAAFGTLNELMPIPKTDWSTFRGMINFTLPEPTR